MSDAGLWTLDRFPVVYDQGEPKAVLVDVESFGKIQTILDNLADRNLEPEDAILAASGLLKKLIDQARATPPSDSWEQELDEL